jgi:DNA-binding NarL/FixJ family response regulator
MVLQSEKDIEIVGEAEHGRDALEKTIDLNPEVALIHLPIPNGGGIEATRAITERCPSTQILILSPHVDLELFRRTVAAGVVGYVLKDITSANLANAIRAVHSGMTIIMPTIVKQIVDALTSENYTSQSKTAGRLHRLTEREIEVLTGLTQGLSDKEIASKLFLSESTVKTHLRAIYHRLKLRNRAQAAAFAVENNFLPGPNNASGPDKSAGSPWSRAR